ncbi:MULTISPECIES: hypothetical protein [Nocardia]|uniref:hypothetical protein n=1 Tax=Nocardia TaxID=1817 RepID=UPI0002F1E01E|nr:MULTISPECIES: hypothetical protein [Nocardia]
MGSTGYHVPIETDTHRFVLDNLRELLPDGHRVVEHCRTSLGTGRHGGWSYALYAAVADTTTTPVTVSASVVLYLRQHREGASEIVVKHLHETEGPVDHEGVTRRVLQALTPTEDPAACEWRGHAIDHHRAVAEGRRRARDAVGAVIRLDRAYTYGHGVGAVEQVLVVSPTSWRRAEITEGRTVTDSPLLRAAPGWALREFEILRAPTQSTPPIPRS